MLSRQVCSTLKLRINIVRLANRLKSLTMSQHSSDEEEESTESPRPASLGDTPAKKLSTHTGAAFAEVVRATIKAKEGDIALHSKTQ